MRIKNTRGFTNAMGNSIWLRGLSTISDNLSKLNVDRWSYMGRLGKTVIYDAFNKFGHVTVKERVFDHTNSRLEDIVKLSKEVGHRKAGLPLPVNSVSKIVGVFKGKYPNRGKYDTYHEDFRVYEALENSKYDLDHYNKKVLPGSWKFSHENLEIMSTPSKSKYTYTDLVEGLFSRVGVDFLIPSLTFYEPEIIKGLLINPKAYSGLITSKLFSKMRVSSTTYTKSISIEYIKNFIFKNSHTIDNSLVSVGGREKRVNLDTQSFKRIKTRAIIMGEDIPTLIGQSIAVPLIKAFQRLNSGFCFIGRSMEQGQYLNIFNKIKCDLKQNISFNADFSSHDNYVDKKRIVVSFAILRLCFPERWRFMDKLFFYCMSSMIYKNVVLPQSKLIYRISKGIPSGHAFTSIVTTVCAYMTFAVAINKTCSPSEIRKDTYLINAGDDVIGKLPLNKINKVNKELQLNSGMKIDALGDHSGPSISNNHNYHISFLKKKFHLHGISWNDLELLDNLIVPTSKKKDSILEIDRCIDLIMDGPCDVYLNNIMRKIIKVHIEKPRSDSLNISSIGINKKNLLASWNYKVRGSPYKVIDLTNYRSSLLKKFNNRIRLATRWFTLDQPFSGLGYKKGDGWIDSTKVITKARWLTRKYSLDYMYRSVCKGVGHDGFVIKNCMDLKGY